MAIEQKMSKEIDDLVAASVKEVPTPEGSTTALKSGKDPRKVYVDQPREKSIIGRTDVNESEKNDHAEESILVNTNPERETEKAETTETTTHLEDSKIQPTVDTLKNFSETSIQATKVKESKVK